MSRDKEEQEEGLDIIKSFEGDKLCGGEGFIGGNYGIQGEEEG